jgi:hypothetical protein
MTITIFLILLFIHPNKKVRVKNLIQKEIAWAIVNQKNDMTTQTITITIEPRVLLAGNPKIVPSLQLSGTSTKRTNNYRML